MLICILILVDAPSVDRQIIVLSGVDQPVTVFKEWGQVLKYQYL